MYWTTESWIAGSERLPDQRCERGVVGDARVGEEDALVGVGGRPAPGRLWRKIPVHSMSSVTLSWTLEED